jgi:RNA 2',3'-cyclic 3'-phosphodiesterase
MLSSQALWKGAQASRREARMQEDADMPRLFTGLELPASVAGQISLVRGGVLGARWLDPEDYHITLRFVGDVDGRLARDIVETLGEIHRPAAQVGFDDLSWFGADRPRAIVARVKADPALIELQAEQERRLRRVGVAPETRKFTPHVTLARLRGVGAAAVAAYLASRGALGVEPFAAERFVLFSARAGSGGGPYVVEAAYPLG